MMNPDLLVVKPARVFVQYDKSRTVNRFLGFKFCANSFYKNGFPAADIAKKRNNIALFELPGKRTAQLVGFLFRECSFLKYVG